MAVSTIVTTPGASNANSYMTLAEANQYMDNRGNAADWAAETDDDILTKMLLQAALDMELLDWSARKYDPTLDDDGNYVQALRFPTIYNYAVNGLYIPIEIKRCQAEQALFLYRLHAATQEAEDQSQVKRFKRGMIEVEFNTPSTGGSDIASMFSQKALEFAKPYLASRLKSIKLVR